MFKPTIVLDAGIATGDNIKWLKGKQYPYIVVSRKKKKEIPSDVTMIAVKEDDKTNTVFVQAGLAKNQETDELELYCHSIDKEKKEESIKNKFQERFEDEPRMIHLRRTSSARQVLKSFLIVRPNGIAAIHVEPAVAPIHYVFDNGFVDLAFGFKPSRGGQAF